RVVAHSMGGAISLLALQTESDLAERVVLVSPMLDIRFGPRLVDGAVASMILTLDRLPFMRTFVLRRFPPPAYVPDRSLWQRLEFREWVKIQFNADMPGMTLHWVAEAHRSIRRILANAENYEI